MCLTTDDSGPSSDKSSKSKMKTFTTPQDYSLIPTIAVTLWMGWNGVLVAMQLYAAFLATPFQRNVIIGIFTVSAILPPKFPYGLGIVVGNWMMQQARKYFGLRVTIEDYDALEKIDKEGKTVIFACEPHDIIPYSVFMFNKSLKIFPGRIGETGSVLMTGAIFQLPIIKHIYSWVGGNPVDKKTFRTRLANNETCAFIPGGVQEVTMLDPKKPEELILYLKNRKGFVKLALERGTPIVPAFFFNLDGSYGSLIPRGNLASQFARKIGFLPLFFWGRWGVPFGIPNPQKIHAVFGDPIDVPSEGEDIQKESVEKYHKLFLEKMEDLFERHKVAEGYGDRTLKIM